MAKLWRNYGENMVKLRRNAGEIKAKLWRNNGETLKIESTLPKKAEFFIQCPNDVMPDPDFFWNFQISTRTCDPNRKNLDSGGRNPENRKYIAQES